MRFRAACVALLSFGCGSVSDSSNNPDAAIDAPDTSAPSIVTSAPAKGATGVAPLTQIVIRFDEKIDAASVTPASVKATWAGRGIFYDIAGFGKYELAGRIVGTVMHDEDGIIFKPLQPLPVNARIELTLEGVKDTYGNVLAAPEKVAFDTANNVEMRWVQYTVSSQAISGYFDFAPVDGRQTLYMPRDTGPDRLWFTMDDTKSNHFRHTYAPAGQLKDAGLVSGAGADMMYGTPDDVISQMYLFRFDAEGRFTGLDVASGFGADMMWGTPDDVKSSSNLHVRWAGHDFIGTHSFNLAGADTVFGTPDDRTSQSFTRYGYNASGFRTQYMTYAPGADQLPDTADDTVTGYSTIATDMNGFVISEARRTIGGDNMWVSPDDGYSSWTKTVRDAKGLPTSIIGYDNAGTDMMWLTNDDVAYSHTSMKYSPEGLLLNEITHNSAGADTKWGTSDDGISRVVTYTYAANGIRTGMTDSSNPGTDMQWMTPDDRLERRIQFDVTK